MQEVIVPTGEAAKKLENFLKKRYPIGYVRKLFRKNAVRLNGRRAKPDDPARAGDHIQLYIQFAAQAGAPTLSRALEKIQTIYEDDSLLVLNKPAGIAVHEGVTLSRKESLVGLVEKKYRAEDSHPRLAHRLDKDTSGVLLFAKNEKALAELEKTFESGEADKQYICLVIGRVPHDDGSIDFPLPGRDGRLVRALTRYRVVKRLAETTLLRVRPETGRLHQIRLHLAKIGHPVALDDQHGDFNFNKRFRKEYGLKRQFLHAEKLAISFAGKQHRWEAPLAPDLIKILMLLETR